MPDLVQFSNGNQILNRYAADGRKLGSEYFTRVTALAAPLTDGQTISQTCGMDVEQVGTAYVGNFEYTTDQGLPSETFLNKVYNAEGYYCFDNTWNYYRRDHLGNNREVWRISPSLGGVGEVAQRTQYYPSGLPWASNTGDNPSLQQRKYNGKEFVEMHGLDEYDSQARWFYPAIMRTTTLDPLAEKYYDISPYAWCSNNPVRLIDPDGRQNLEADRRVKKNTSEVTAEIEKITGKVENFVNERVNDIKQTVKEAATDAQKVVKDNKETIFKFADAIQKSGDQMVTGGYLLTGAGVVTLQPEVAAAGLCAVGVGTVGGAIGDGLELLTDVVVGDTKQAKNKAIETTVGVVCGKGNLPGYKALASNSVNKLASVTNELYKNYSGNAAENITKKILNGGF